MQLLNLKARYPGAALITGASSGIGEVFARRLAAEGVDLVLVARRRDRLEALAAELTQAHGVAAYPIGMDLARAGSGTEVKGIVETHGIEVGILVNNAGFGSLGIFTRLEPDREAAMVDLNCRAGVELTSCFAPAMVKRRNGAILFVSSLAAFQPTPFFSTYGATKSFNLFFAEGLWAELRPHGVDVLALCPGFTRSEFQEAAGLKTPQNVRWDEPEDVVETGLLALGKGPSVVHGLKNKVVSHVHRFLTRRAMARLSHWIRLKELNGNWRTRPE